MRTNMKKNRCPRSFLRFKVDRFIGAWFIIAPYVKGIKRYQDFACQTFVGGYSFLFSILQGGRYIDI